MATLLATDLTRSNRYQEAAALMQSLAGQLQAQGVDTATTTPILQAADLYTAYARVALSAARSTPRTNTTYLSRSTTTCTRDTRSRDTS